MLFEAFKTHWGMSPLKWRTDCTVVLERITTYKCNTNGLQLLVLYWCTEQKLTNHSLVYFAMQSSVHSCNCNILCQRARNSSQIAFTRYCSTIRVTKTLQVSIYISFAETGEKGWHLEHLAPPAARRQLWSSSRGLYSALQVTWQYSQAYRPRKHTRELFLCRCRFRVLRPRTCVTTV